VEVWLWPNVLTLQAPLVAVLWQVLLARSLHLRLNPFEPWALAMAVWLIYVADHLIDTAGPVAGAWEPPRKEFCRRHWSKFLGVSIAVGLTLADLMSRWFWTPTVQAGWALALAVAGYFALIHVAPASWRGGWPREVAVATVFSLGTFLAVWAEDGRRLSHLLPAAVLFAMLCWTNCSVIETWEWEAMPNPAARWIGENLLLVSVTIAGLAGLLWVFTLITREIAAATCLSGGGLALLALYRRRIPMRLVSPLADLALCTPAFVLAFRTIT